MKTVVAIGLVVGILLGYGCSTFEYRTAVREGGAAVMVELPMGGTRKMGFWEWNSSEGGWPVIRDVLTGCALGGIVYLGEENDWWSGGSSAADVTVNTYDSSRAVIAIDGSDVSRSLNTSSFNQTSSRTESSSRTSSNVTRYQSTVTSQ